MVALIENLRKLGGHVFESFFHGLSLLRDERIGCATIHPNQHMARRSVPRSCTFMHAH